MYVGCSLKMKKLENLNTTSNEHGRASTAWRRRIQQKTNKRLIQRTSSSGPRIQDVVDLSKMVQVVCRFQADELLDRLPSAYLVDPIALHPPCARDRLQQSQVALAQRPKDP